MSTTITDRTSKSSFVKIIPFFPNRFIVNNVDTYFGKYLLKSLRKLVPPKPEYSPPSIHGEEEVVIRETTPPPPYEIFGTVHDKNIKTMDGVRIISEKEFNYMAPHCGNVIINIGDDSDSFVTANQYIHKMDQILENASDLEITGQVRQFVLLSTPMTWARTKPMDKDASEVPLTEKDFRKRRAHPNFKPHYDIENNTLKLARSFKGKMNAVVVVPGVKYGGKEDILHYWFQKAWENERVMSIIGSGSNTIPLINVNDLADIMASFVQLFPKKLYLLAVEEAPTTQRQIVKALSKQFGTGIYKKIPRSQALELKGMTEQLLDFMTVNTIMEPSFISENIKVDWSAYWKTETFAEKALGLMKEFKMENNLKPFKIILHGPPGVGKTTLAQRLCENYGLIYICPDTIIEQTIEDLAWRLDEYITLSRRQSKNQEEEVAEEAIEEEGIDEDDDDEPDDWGEMASETKNELLLLKSGTIGDDDDKLSYMRKKITRNECLNIGWVLDGYPEIFDQCSSLFERGEETDDEEKSETEDDEFEEDIGLLDSYLKKILPSIVVALTASDDFIKRKFMSFPECDVKNTKFDEPVLLERLREFRLNNKNDNTVLNFYDEIDIHPVVLNAEKDDYGLSLSYDQILKMLGQPVPFGAVLKRILAQEEGSKAEAELKRKEKDKAQRDLEDKMIREREDKMEKWTELMNVFNEEEEAALAAQRESLRNYMMKYVLPTLSAGLLELSKVRPSDPVDFLAEFLFQQNPSGRILDPGFNLQCETLLNQIQIIDEDKMNKEVVIPEKVDVD